MLRPKKLKAWERATGLTFREWIDKLPAGEAATNISTPVQPLAARVREIWRDMPEEVRIQLPADGASQVDHSVHGLPKRDQ